MKITLYQPTLSLLLLLFLSGGCAVNREKEKTTTPQASPLAEIVLFFAESNLLDFYISTFPLFYVAKRGF